MWNVNVGKGKMSQTTQNGDVNEPGGDDEQYKRRTEDKGVETGF